jgi:hypothetical protein
MNRLWVTAHDALGKRVIYKPRIARAARDRERYCYTAEAQLSLEVSLTSIPVRVLLWTRLVCGLPSPCPDVTAAALGEQPVLSQRLGRRAQIADNCLAKCYPGTRYTAKSNLDNEYVDFE